MIRARSVCGPPRLATGSVARSSVRRGVGRAPAGHRRCTPGQGRSAAAGPPRIPSTERSTRRRLRSREPPAHRTGHTGSRRTAGSRPRPDLPPGGQIGLLAPPCSSGGRPGAGGGRDRLTSPILRRHFAALSCDERVERHHRDAPVAPVEFERPTEAPGLAPAPDRRARPTQPVRYLDHGQQLSLRARRCGAHPAVRHEQVGQGIGQLESSRP